MWFEVVSFFVQKLSCIQICLNHKMIDHFFCDVKFEEIFYCRICWKPFPYIFFSSKPYFLWSEIPSRKNSVPLPTLSEWLSQLYLFLKVAYSFLHLSRLVHHPDHLVGLPYGFLDLPGLLHHPDHLVGLSYSFLHFTSLDWCIIIFSLVPMHFCQKIKNILLPTIFYMNIIVILRFETGILVTCISLFNFLFSFFCPVFQEFFWM